MAKFYWVGNNNSPSSYVLSTSNIVFESTDFGSSSSNPAYSLMFDSWETAPSTTKTNITPASNTNGRVIKKFVSTAPIAPISSFDIVFEPFTGLNASQSKNIISQNSAAIRFTKSTYIGSGELIKGGFVSNTKVTYNPPETPPNFILTGINIERATKRNFNTISFITTGSLINKLTNSYIGASPKNYYDAFDIVFDNELNYLSGSIKLSSTSRYKNVDVVSASGSFAVSGNSLIKFGNQAGESTNLFTVSGTCREQFNSNAGESVSLFAISGNKTEQNTESYVGSVSKAIFNPSDIAFEILEPNVRYDNKLYSSSIYKDSNKEIGSGTISLQSTTAWEFSSNTPENTQLFEISGTGVWKASRSDNFQLIEYRTVTTRILPTNNSVSILSGVTVVASGSGTGSGTGNFNIGPHFRFDGTNISRFFTTIAFDFNSYTEWNNVTGSGLTITASGIKGNNTNGGEEPDSGEDLILEFSTPSIAFTRVSGVLIGEADATFNSLKAVTKVIPSGVALVSGVTLRIRQLSSSGNDFDNYGIQSIDVNQLQKRVITGTQRNIEFNGSNQQEKVYSWKGTSPTVPFESYDIAFENLESSAPIKTRLQSSATFKETNREIGSGTVTLQSATTWAFSPQTPENTQLFQISGAAEIRRNPLEFGSGTYQVSGSSQSKLIKDFTGTSPTVPFESYDIAFENLESEAPIKTRLQSSSTWRIIPATRIGSGAINTSGASTNQRFTFQGTESIQLFQISGAAEIRRNPLEFGSGTYEISGSSQSKLIKDFIGTSPTVPFEAFDVAFENLESSLPIKTRLQSSATFKEINSNVGSGQITISANNIYYGIYQPVENVQLFEITGAVTNVQFISQGTESTSLFTIDSGSTSKLIKDFTGTSPTVPFEAFDVAFENLESDSAIKTRLQSSATFKEINREIGTGTINTSGASTNEQFVFQGTESTQLFQISGAAEVRRNPLEFGSGGYQVSGSSQSKLIKDFIGTSPTVPFEAFDVAFENLESSLPIKTRLQSSATWRIIPQGEIGTGTINTSGASTNEQFVFQGTESTQLFQISGAVTNVQFISQGTESTILFTLDSGSSSKLIKDFTGTSPTVPFEAFDVAFENLESEAPIKTRLQSSATFKETNREIGSGTVTLQSATTWAFSPQTPENTQLFEISGVADVSRNPLEFGSGTYEISGSSQSKLIKDFIGTSPTVPFEAYDIAFENLESSLPIKTRLQSSATFKETNREIGSGQITISANNIYYGIYQPVENTQLFEITGTATWAFSPQTPENTQLFEFNSGSSSKLIKSFYGTSPTVPFEAFDVAFENLESEAPIKTRLQSSATFKEINSNVGSGQITISANNIYYGIYQPVENTQLFQISGAAEVRRNPLEFGSGTYEISGSSQSKLIKSFYGTSPTVPFEAFDVAFENLESDAAIKTRLQSSSTWISIPGTRIGSGTINTSGASTNEQFVFQGTESTQLFEITGIATGIQFISNAGESTILFTLDSGSSSKLIKSFSGTSPTVPFEAFDVAFENLESDAAIKTRLQSSSTWRIIPQGEIGTGTINTSGASTNEQFVFQGTESTQLFEITGTSEVRRNPLEFGSGTYEISGSSQSKLIKDFTGTSPTVPFEAFDVAFENLESEAPIKTKLQSSATWRIIPQGEIGTGTINTSGASTNEQFVFQGTESTQLFEITGAVTNIQFVSNAGESTSLFTIDSGSTSKLIKSFYGTSPTVPFESYDIAFENLESEAPIKTRLQSSSTWRSIPGTRIGSGTVTLQSATTWAFSPQTPENTQLFEITGTTTWAFSPQTPENTQLFNITGTGKEIIEKVWVGTSPTVPFESYDIAFETFESDAPIKTRLQSSATFREINSNVGSGTVTLQSATTWAFSPQTPENTQLFEITGTATWAFSPQTPENTQLFAISGTSKESAREVWVGTSPTVPFESYDIAFETFESDAPIKTRITSSSFYSLTQGGEIGSGTIDISGAYSRLQATYDNVGSGTVTLQSATTWAFSPQTPENTQLFAISGTSKESAKEVWVGTSPTVPFEAFDVAFENLESEAPVKTRIISSSAYSFVQGGEIGSGTINTSGAYSRLQAAYANNKVVQIEVSGSARTLQSPAYAGTGTITLQSTTTYAFSAQSPENTQLFEITGTKSTESFGKGTYTGSGTINTSGAYSRLQAAKAWAGTGTISITGTAKAQYISIFDSLGFFLVDGVALHSYTQVVVPQPSGNIEISGERTENFSKSNYIGSGEKIIGGTATNIKFTSGAGESTQLFEIGGAATKIQITPSIAGTGSIGIISGTSYNETYQTPDGTQLLSITGTANEAYSRSRYLGTGTFKFVGGLFPVLTGETITYSRKSTINLQISGIAKQISVVSNISSGSLFAVSGASESFSVQTSDNTQLFDISGTSTIVSTSQNFGSGSVDVYNSKIEKVSKSNIGFGSITLSGESANELYFSIRYYKGSGSLFAVSGASQSFSAQTPENTNLFNISSTTAFASSIAQAGSGSLFAVSGASQSFSAQTPENVQLLEISGNSNNSISTKNIGIGQIAISGGTTPILNVLHVGSGSLFAVSGASQSFGAQTPENVQLLEISGVSEVKFTTGSYKGTGSLFKSGGSSESTVKVITGTELFDIQGTSKQKFVKSNYIVTGAIDVSGNCNERFIPATIIGSGSTNINSGYNNIKSSISEFGSGDVYISGTATNIHRKDVWEGSGSIFTFNSGTVYGIYQSPENVQIIQISGSCEESFTPSTEIGTGTQEITGEAVNSVSYVNYSTGDITINGNAEGIAKATPNTGTGRIKITGFVSDTYIPAYSQERIFITII